MARERTPEQWANLSPTYRNRLINHGITRESYVAGVNLSSARGQKSESARPYQQKLVREYGPVDKAGRPAITPALLKKARAKHGDAWVTAQLEAMRDNNKRYKKGYHPHGGADKLEDRTPEDQEYATNANEDINDLAPFWWYHGTYG